MSERRAAERAARGAAPEREATLGPVLLQHLYGALRGLRLYSSANQALREHLQQLLASISALMDDEVTLLGMGEHFFLNDVRLKPDPARVGLWRSLIAELEKARGVRMTWADQTLAGNVYSREGAVEERGRFRRIEEWVVPAKDSPDLHAS